jgi:hypothetical protein
MDTTTGATSGTKGTGETVLLETVMSQFGQTLFHLEPARATISALAHQ